MIDAKINNEKFCIPIKLIGKKVIVTDFYIDTGFNGLLKIDKKLFDELELECIRNETVNLGHGQEESADIAKVKIQTDNLTVECEIMAVGWGGRNLIGTKFLNTANIILIIDGTHGICLSNDRNLAYKIGETIFMHNNKEYIV